MLCDVTRFSFFSYCTIVVSRARIRNDCFYLFIFSICFLRQPFFQSMSFCFVSFFLNSFPFNFYLVPQMIIRVWTRYWRILNVMFVNSAFPWIALIKTRRGNLVIRCWRFSFSFWISNLKVFIYVGLFDRSLNEVSKHIQSIVNWKSPRLKTTTHL